LFFFVVDDFTPFHVFALHDCSTGSLADVRRPMRKAIKYCIITETALPAGFHDYSKPLRYKRSVDRCRVL